MVDGSLVDVVVGILQGMDVDALFQLVQTGIGGFVVVCQDIQGAYISSGKTAIYGAIGCCLTLGALAVQLSALELAL